jgi:FkbM family methyltransferase
MVQFGFPEPALWRVQPLQVLHPLHIRLRGSSDISVFDQIFVFQEYKCLSDINEPLRILDLGANVGFSSAYFLSIYPNARVLAVEPDDRNLQMCRINLSSYGDRVVLLHGAVWSKPTKLRVLKGSFGDGREWATQVEEVNTAQDELAEVEAWDVGTLIEMIGGKSLDLLKMDIEGAERFVFGGHPSGDWLRRVRNICIELHGKDCEEAFFSALANFDYEVSHSGELTICRNLRPKVVTLQ